MTYVYVFLLCESYEMQNILDIVKFSIMLMSFTINNCVLMNLLYFPGNGGYSP